MKTLQLNRSAAILFKLGDVFVQNKARVEAHKIAIRADEMTEIVSHTGERMEIVYPDSLWVPKPTIEHSDRCACLEGAPDNCTARYGK